MFHQNFLFIFLNVSLDSEVYVSDRPHECIKKATLMVTDFGFSFRVKYGVSGRNDLDLDLDLTIFKEQTRVISYCVIVFFC